MKFSELGLHQSLCDACDSAGFFVPTPIQRQSIPSILGGSDLIGYAATGTGKTAAFLLPMLQRLSSGKRQGVRALILAPTRELASQIDEKLQALDVNKRFRSVIITGGASAKKQCQELRRGVSIIIATPGRLLDHLENRAINLAQLEVLVLDEADRMLDLGFLPAIRYILGLLPARRQTLLFSATMSPAIEEIARAHMLDPEIVEVDLRGKAVTTVKQTAYPVARESKTSLLLHLLEREDYPRVLIFTRTKRGAERLSHILAARDHRVDRIHADRTQPQREAALRGFKDGRHRVLVATDIAARGIDVEAVSHVINYDVPEAPEDYIHRIGRTGRAGNSGHAISLVTPVEELSIRAIERLTGQLIERVWLPAFGGSSTSLQSAGQFTSLGSRGSYGQRSFRSHRARR